MRIVFYTSGLNGIGRIALAISIGNALKRKEIKCKYTVVHSSLFGYLLGDIDQKRLPLENDLELSVEHYHKSLLYKTLTGLKPDIIIVDHMWFTVYNFIKTIRCKKIYITDGVYDSHFKIPLTGGELIFQKSHYDRVLAIEPFKCEFVNDMINPLIMHNRDEILTREKSLNVLNLDPGKKIALYAFSGHPGDYERYLDKYSYLEKEGFQIVHASIYKDSVFPLIDYFNAFDFIVSGAGYNQVWEIRYFKKNAIFEPTHQRFWDQSLRLKEYVRFHFDENGADQLVDMLMNM